MTGARNELTRALLAGAGGASGERLRAEAMREPGLVAKYGDRFMSRPVLLDAAETARLTADLNTLFDLLVDLPRRSADGDLRAYGRLLGLSPAYVELVLRTGTDRPVMLGRADMHHADGGFRLLEYNLSSSVGGIDGEAIAAAAMRVPAIGDFAATHGLSFVDTTGRILDLLRDRVGPGSPSVALMDWPTSYRTAAPSLWAYAGILSKAGFPTIACHAGQARWSDGRLTVHNRPVDVVYRVFTLHEMMRGTEPMEVADPLLRAVDAGAVDLFLPFDTELYSNKAALALLTDDLLSPAEKAVVDRILPWTRSLDRLSDRDDVLDHARARRADLVLKPALGSAGRGIVPGWTTTDADWSTAVRGAVGNGFVLQERIRPGAETFVDDGRATPWWLKWGIVTVDRRYAGTLVQGTRNPEAGVTNRAAADGVAGALHEALSATGSVS
jgi:hypothetical protein